MKRISKRLWSVLLITVLLAGSLVSYPTIIAGAASNNTVVQAVKSKTCHPARKYTKSSRYLPDFGAFISYVAELDYRHIKEDRVTECWEKVPASNGGAMVETFVKLLQDDRFHLKLEREDDLGNRVNYYFRYAGSSKVTPVKKIDGKEYHAALTYYDKVGRINFEYAPEFQAVDTLDRADGTTAKNPAIKGTSARKAIVKDSGGKYQTSDKRLAAKTGYADVIINGKHYSKKAVLSANVTNSGKYDNDELLVANVWDKKDIKIQLPHGETESGDLYDMTDVLYFNKDAEPDFQIADTGKSSNQRPKCSPDNAFDYVTIRVAKWNTTGVSILYFAAKYTDKNGKDYTIEGLAAVKYKDRLLEAGEEVTLKKGGTANLTFNHREFLPNYETYAWEVISGADKVTLSKKTSQICKVTAKKEGTAVIRVTYDYGKDEPDVLTGIKRNFNHKKTMLYRVNVTK